MSYLILFYLCVCARMYVQVAETYGVKPMGGTLMHQMKRLKNVTCCVYCDYTCSKIVSHVVLTIMIPMIISCCGFLFRSYNIIFSNTVTNNYLYFSVCVYLCVCGLF